MPVGVKTLDHVLPGETACVAECLGDGATLQRLCEMGFVPGVAVRVVRYAPLGDPMQVELYGCHVSLRKSEAALLRVESGGSSLEEPRTGGSQEGLERLEPACGPA